MMFVLACGDNLGPAGAGGNGETDGGGGGGAEDGGPEDGGPDASTIVCEPPAAGAPGSACSAPEDCDSAEGAGDGRCLDADQRDVAWPETGYCVRICAAEATDCGEGTTCFAQEGFTRVLCLPLCCEGIACAAGFACSTAFLGQAIGAAVCLPGDRSAADGSPCESIADCDANSDCVPDQSGTTGVCTTVGCTPGDDATCAPGGDGTCVEGEPPVCRDPCESTEDCATTDGQRCDPEDMACRHSVVGDPCAADGACGQAPWDCLTEAEDDHPGGYCTLPCGGGCPDGTVCNDELLGGGEAHCVESCTLVAGCPREGYQCMDVSSTGLLRGCVPDIL